MSDLSWLGNPPYATLIILGASALLSFLVTFINSLFTPKEQREQLRKWNKEIREWTSESVKARRTGDKKLLKKVQKQEKRIKQLQAKMAKQSLNTFKVMPISIALFVVIWLCLTGRVMYVNVQLFEGPINAQTPVAYLPWLGETPIALYLFQWYLICSFAVGTLFSRVFGLSMGTE